MPSAIRVIDDITELGASGFNANEYAKWNGSVFVGDTPAAGGSPGGNDKQIQFNNSAAFGGAAGFEYQSGASPNVSLQAQNAAYVPLLVKAAASQSANRLEVQDSAGNVDVRITAAGRLVPNLHTDISNVMIGNAAGNSTATGDHNIMLGNNTGAALTSGYDNVFIGDGCGQAATEGYRNVCVGINSGNDIIGGSGNVLLGVSAGDVITSGSSNFGLGTSALGGLTTGNYNVAVGDSSIRNATIQTNNVGVGAESLMYSVGYSNIGIGYGATRCSAATGSGGYNIGIGEYSLYGLTSGGSNVMIGIRAGFSVTTGGSNISLGYYAGSRQTNLSNRLIIDNQQRADAATEITNAIFYGVMAAAPANQTLRINAALTLSQVKSGANQAGAGAAAGEVWKTASHATLPDNVLMIGV